MFGCLILLGVGIVIGIYIVSQISRKCDNNKLEQNLKNWESSHEVKYQWREEEKRNRQK